MHEAPLVEAVIVEVDLAGIDRVQDVLRPRHQQPDDRALFLGHGTQDPIGAHAAQNDSFRSFDQPSHPMHLGADVIERRDAEEIVVMGLAMVLLLGDGGAHEARMPMEDGLWEARRAAREIDRAQIGVLDAHARLLGREVTDARIVALGEARAALADVIETLDLRDIVDDVFDAPDEFLAEHKRVHLGELQAVLDLVRGIAVVERNRDGAALERPHVDGKPLQAVHEQDGHLAVARDAGIEEQMREAVRMLVEDAPGHFTTISLGRAGFDQVVFQPRRSASLANPGIHLDERDVVRIEGGVLREEIGDGHRSSRF